MDLGWLKNTWGFGKKIIGFFQLKKDVEELKTTVAKVREDINQVRGDISPVREDISRVREDINQVRGDISPVREDINQVREDISRQPPYTQSTSIQDDPPTINPQFSAPNVESATRRAELQEIELRLSEDDRARLNRLRRFLHYWFDVEE